MFAFEAVDALDRYLAAPGTRSHAIVATSNAFPFSLHTASAEDTPQAQPRPLKYRYKILQIEIYRQILNFSA